MGLTKKINKTHQIRKWRLRGGTAGSTRRPNDSRRQGLPTGGPTSTMCAGSFSGHHIFFFGNEGPKMNTAHHNLHQQNHEQDLAVQNPARFPQLTCAKSFGYFRLPAKYRPPHFNALYFGALALVMQSWRDCRFRSSGKRSRLTLDKYSHKK